MANAANLINFGSGGGGALAVGDWTYSAYPLSAPTYLPLNNEYASYLASSYPTLAPLYTTPVTAYSGTSRTLGTGSITPSSLVYGNGIWVIAGTGLTFVLTSPDGINWTRRATPCNVDRVVYGNGRFIGITQGSATCAYSFDGISWVAGTNLSIACYQIAYGNGNFVGFHDGGTANGCISSNGTFWRTVSLLYSDLNGGVAYGNGTFVAVCGSSASGQTSYSKDGGNGWLAAGFPSANGASGVTYGNGLFVTSPLSATNVYFTSPDGISWTQRIFPVATSWNGTNSICFGNGVFFAVSSTNGTISYSSPDGVTWTSRVLPATNPWRNIGFGGPSNAGYFVATGTASNSATLNLSVAQTSFGLPLISNSIANTTPYIKAS